MGANYRKELEAGGGGTPMIGGNISARGSMSKADRAQIDAMRKEAIQEDAVRDVKIAKSAPERKAALKEATTEVKDGVKVTKYPYVEPSARRQNYRSLDDTLQRIDDMGYKKGGKVSSASKRADGCCVRGKTRA